MPVFAHKPVWQGLAAAALLLGAVGAAQAQVYKCTVNGRSTFQERPCDSGASAQTTVRPAAAQWPWQGVRARMTEAQVRQAVPGVHPGTGDRLNNGAQDLLRRHPVSLLGVAGYEVNYFFLPDGLHQIAAQQPRMDRSHADVQAEFARLSTALRREWGKPHSERPLEARAHGLSGQLEWRLPNGDIAWLQVLPVTADMSFLGMGYRFQGAAAAR